MIKIDGGQIAAEIIGQLKKEAVPQKSLVGLLVGSNRASLSFLKQKKKAAEGLGIEFKLFEFDDSVSQAVVERQLETLADNERVGGVIVQLPLPEKFDLEAVLEIVPPEKDVDNLSGRASVAAPAVGAVKSILKNLAYDLAGKKVLVIGQGRLVGRPVAIRLIQEGVEVKTADINTGDLQTLIGWADLVISGVGQADLINPAWLKRGAGMIDFGYPADLNNQLPMDNYEHLAFYTPTPGGTGPVLVAELFRNFYKLTK